MKKILIADDDQPILEVLSLILKDAGYTVSVLDQSQDIYSKIASFQPDLILLDIWMSGIDGRQVTQQLKSKEETKHIPVILISANNETEQITKEAKADGFIRKPFNIEDLLGNVKKFLKE